MNNEFIPIESQTNWQLLDSMTDEDIDLSDCPEITPEMFATALVRRGLPKSKTKEQVTLRIDSDVLEWFKSQGRGYQTQINSLVTTPVVDLSTGTTRASQQDQLLL